MFQAVVLQEVLFLEVLFQEVLFLVDPEVDQLLVSAPLYGIQIWTRGYPK